MKSPLYYKIYRDIRKKIDSGKFKTGALLPTEKELEDLFNASRSPVRQALALLESEGAILRRPGKGTFVAPPVKEMQMWLNFSPFRRYFQEEWETTQCKTLLVDEVNPPLEVRDFFMMEEDRKVIYIERVRLSKEGHPVILNHLYVNPLFNVKKFVSAGDFFSLRALLMEKFSIEVTRIEDTLSSVPASGILAKHLDVPIGHPLLETKRNTFSEDTPVLLDTFYTVTDIWKYRVTFEKGPNGNVTAMASN